MRIYLEIGKKTMVKVIHSISFDDDTLQIILNLRGISLCHGPWIYTMFIVHIMLYYSQKNI